MSEYAGLSSGSKDKLKFVPNEDGDALFDVTLEDPRGESDVEVHLEVTSYPLSIEKYKALLQGRDLGRRALIDDREPSAHEDLGGGIYGAHLEQEFLENLHPLDSLVRSYQGWEADIRVAIEQFGMAELTITDLDHMTKADKELLAKHFDGFYNIVKAHFKLIYAAEGKVEYYPVLGDLYGKDRTDAELIEYANRLVELNKIIHDSKVAHELLKLARQLEPNQTARREKYRKNKIQHGECRVAFETTRSGTRKPVARRFPYQHS